MYSVCKQPIALQDDVLRRRIFSPQSYAVVRNMAVVPVVHSECAVMASWFPLVWRQREQGVELVVVRALLDEQRAQPRVGREVLPLALLAYPFVLDPSEPAGPNARRMIEDVFADAPTDVGATITTQQHRLSRATTSRFRFLDRFALEAPLTGAISEAIATLDVLEPWPLQFDVDGYRLTVPDLMLIRSSSFDSGRFAPLLRTFGMPCAVMLSLHRVSLFRAGGLLAAARALIKDGGLSGGATSDDHPETGAALALAGAEVLA